MARLPEISNQQSQWNPMRVHTNLVVKKANNHKHHTEYWIIWMTNLMKGGYITYWANQLERLQIWFVWLTDLTNIAIHTQKIPALKSVARGKEWRQTWLGMEMKQTTAHKQNYLINILASSYMYMFRPY